MVTRKKTDIVQLSKVRIREALRRKLERDAKREKTTLNAQIVRRIEELSARGGKNRRVA